MGEGIEEHQQGGNADNGARRMPGEAAGGQDPHAATGRDHHPDRRQREEAAEERDLERVVGLRQQFHQRIHDRKEGDGQNHERDAA